MEKTVTTGNWSPKRPGYWKLYHQSHEYDALEVFKAICWSVILLDKMIKYFNLID